MEQAQQALNTLTVFVLLSLLLSIVALVFSLRKKINSEVNISDKVDEYLKSLLGDLFPKDLASLSSELRQKLQDKVSEYLLEQFPDLIYEDDDIRQAILDALENEIPKLVSQVLESEEVRKKLGETIVNHLTSIIENAPIED